MSAIASPVSAPVLPMSSPPKQLEREAQISAKSDSAASVSQILMLERVFRADFATKEDSDWRRLVAPLTLHRFKPISLLLSLTFQRSSRRTISSRWAPELATSRIET